MKKLWYWLLLLILILILLGLWMCPAPTPPHDHFVSSGNLFFQGNNPGGYNIDKNGDDYNPGSNCFNPVNPLEIEYNFDLPIACEKLVTANAITTAAGVPVINFDPVLGSAGKTELKVLFFNNGILDQGVNVKSLQLIKNNTSVQSYTPANEAAIEDQSSQSDYFYKVAKSSCVAQLRFKVEIDGTSSPGAPLHIVLQIKNHDNYHNHTVVYPNCLASLARARDTLNSGLAEDSSPAETPDLNQLHSPIARSGATGCNPLPPDNTLAYYECLEASQCHIMDHVLIFALPQVCIPSSPGNSSDPEI